MSRYAAYLTGLIGGLQLLTCFVWVMVHNPIPLVIPFEDGIIKIALGMHFWITFGCGDYDLNRPILVDLSWHLQFDELLELANLGC